MANSNVSISNRLFAYIKYKDDVTDNIVNQYNHSLIFIGDEKQIFAPEMGAYVGIGMSAYNSVLDRIDGLKTDIDKASAAVKGQVVSSIYPNVTKELKINGNAPGAPVAEELTYMVGSVGIVGIHDYDTTTHKATNTQQVQISYDSSTGAITNTSFIFKEGQIGYNPTDIPTSGIRIRYSQETEVVEGNTVQSNNVLYIDDSYTWSYIAYNSEVQRNLNKKYIDSEINKVYHDLLGDEITYVPVSFNNVFDSVNNETPAHTIDTGVKYYYQVEASTDSGVAKAGVTTKPDGNTVDYGWQEAEFDSNGGITNLLNKNYWINSYPDHENIPQLFVAGEDNYDTYNKNLKDGINTLKEVAYLLDVLSDGGIGKVTYITYAEYSANGFDTTGWNLVTNALADENSNAPYAYKATDPDPENLGIQMAYSIAGNKAEIDHLHEHIKKGEQGLTTVRSINTIYNSALGTLSIVNGGIPNTAYLSESDAEAGKISRPQHYVGDPSVSLNLVLTNTYLSINNALWTEDRYNATNVGFGKEYYGEFLKVKASEIDVDAARKASGTEGKIEVFIVNAPVQEGETRENVSLDTIKTSWNLDNWLAHQATSTQLNDIQTLKESGLNEDSSTYYFIRTKEGYTRDQFDNVIWIKVNSGDLANETYDGAEYSDYYQSTNEGFEVINVSQTNTNPAKAADILTNGTNIGNVYVYKISDTSPYELKPIIYTNTNAIATADWVSSYISQEIKKVNAAQNDFAANIEDTINSKLNNLDYEYQYSDFETILWNNYANANSSTLIPGSTSYWEEYNRLYESFKTELNNSSSAVNVAYRSINTDLPSSFAIGTSELADNLYRNSYNSTAIVNIIQKDGKVSAQVRELPSAYVNVNVDVWGETESIEAKPKYQALSSTTRTDILTDLNEVEAVTGNQIDALYTLNKDVNELFVLSSTITQYKAVNAGDNISNAALYEYDQLTGTYKAATNVDSDLRSAITDGNHSYKGWKQFYVLESTPKYVELDINQTTFENGTFTFKDIDGNLYENVSTDNVKDILYYIWAYIKDGVDISETSESVASAEGNNLSAKLRNYVASRRYLTAEFNHHDYSNGGNGENTLNLTAHITKLEDATPENSGFADAWDVKSYIDELFRFVDVSASITENILVNRDAFYTLISYEEWEGTGADLYVKNNDTWTKLTTAPVTARYYNSNNGYAGATTATIDTPTTIRFNRSGSTTAPYSPTTNNYSIRNENVFMNPLNLTLTNHGA